MFRACSGRVVFASFFKKKSGACSGRVQCVPVTFKFPKKGEKQRLHSYDFMSYRVCKNYYKIRKQSRLEAYLVYKHTQKPDLPISNTH